MEKRIHLQQWLAEHGTCISIEGGIGAGKSKTNHCLSTLGYATENEPVDAWTLLPLFYGDQSKYAFASQLQIVTSYVGVARKEESPYVMLERSPLTALEVFARMLAAKGKISPEHFDLLHSAADALPLRKVDIILFLKVPIKTCLARIAKRGRSGEDAIQGDYLAELEACYEAFLAKESAKGTRVIVIDGSGFENKSMDLALHIEEVLFKALVEGK